MPELRDIRLGLKDRKERIRQVRGKGEKVERERTYTPI